MTAGVKVNYRSKSISLAEDTWEAFDKARDIHGSYNKVLKFALSAGGVFEEETTDICPHTPSCDPNCGSLTILKPYPRNVSTRERKPLLKPSEKKGK